MAGPKPRRWIYLLSAAGAAYSLFVVAWFFYFFAKPGDGSIAIPASVFGLMTAAPYLVIWLAEKISCSLRVSKATLAAVVVITVTSIIAYAPGLRPHQDGEFAALFFLAIPQLILAIGCLLLAIFSRYRSS
jgi:hypothetical protein